MDPTVLAAIISALVGGVAGEAGKSAWASLTALARDRFGRDSPEAAALEAAPAGDTREIAGILVDRAEADPEFRESLASWTAETGKIIQRSHDVSNTISGDARIHGTVIQAGDIFGSIDLGSRRDPDR
ncbi:hypothetical protein [Sphaerisporangium corydalis]|uniref:Uncharacterized protein n=1 Tax=Sphaerisporangium corydalis TaxID=1441875 RepID=A0ABV9ERW6_9ACTN|nr:hypothetical protein [Sphaerisporangium corydalis]